MKIRLSFIVAALAMSFNAQSVTIDFESVSGLTALNTNTQGTSLPANSSIVGEIPGLVISSLGPGKDVDINGDGTNDSNFSGVSWLDFTGTGSTAHSGSRVITGASDDPSDSTLDVVDFTNFVEFRLLNTGNKFFKIWLEVVSGSTVRAIFRDDINGGGSDLSTQDVTSSGFVEFLSPTADIRNVVFIPIAGTNMWLDDLTYAASNGNGGGGTTPEPGSLALLALGLIGFALARKKSQR